MRYTLTEQFLQWADEHRDGLGTFLKAKGITEADYEHTPGSPRAKLMFRGIANDGHRGLDRQVAPEPNTGMIVLDCHPNDVTPDPDKVPLAPRDLQPGMTVELNTRNFKVCEKFGELAPGVTALVTDRSNFIVRLRRNPDGFEAQFDVDELAASVPFCWRWEKAC